MKAGKIALVSVLILASAGLIYAGYRLIKNAVKNMKEKAVAKYLNSKSETDKEEAENTAGSDYITPSSTTLSQNITWAAEGDPLKIGAIGVGATSGVQRLQTALNSKKSAGLTVDGYFGSLTETALFNGYKVKEILLSDLTKLEAGTYSGTDDSIKNIKNASTEYLLYAGEKCFAYSQPSPTSTYLTIEKGTRLGYKTGDNVELQGYTLYKMKGDPYNTGNYTTIYYLKGTTKIQ